MAWAVSLGPSWSASPRASRVPAESGRVSRVPASRVGSRVRVPCSARRALSKEAQASRVPSASRRVTSLSDSSRSSKGNGSWIGPSGSPSGALSSGGGGAAGALSTRRISAPSRARRSMQSRPRSRQSSDQASSRRDRAIRAGPASRRRSSSTRRSSGAPSTPPSSYKPRLAPCSSNTPVPQGDRATPSSSSTRPTSHRGNRMIRRARAQVTARFLKTLALRIPVRWRSGCERCRRYRRGARRRNGWARPARSSARRGPRRSSGRSATSR